MEILTGKIYKPEYYPDLNLYDFYTRTFREYADHIAFRFRNNPKDEVPVSRTYRETSEDAEALAVALKDLQGDNKSLRKIAVVGANSYYWCLTYLATVMHLGTIVPLDPMLPAQELLPLLERGKVDTFVCDAAYMTKLGAAIKDLPLLQNKIYMCLEKESEKNQALLLQAAQDFGYQSLNSLLKAGRESERTGEEAQRLQLLPQSTAALLFTSGTTARSKAVMLSHYNITSDLTALLRVIDMPRPLKHLCLLPLHHCFENTCGFQAVLALGGEISMCDGLRYLSKNLLEYHPNLLIGVPAIYDALYKKIFTALRKQKKLFLFNILRGLSRFLYSLGFDCRRRLFRPILANFGGEVAVGITGAAPIRRNVVDFFHELGIEVLQGYGLTECTPVVAGCNSYYAVAGSCGQPLGGVTVAIDNEEDGQDGEILVKINDYPALDSKPEERELHITMLGYYEDEQATEATLLPSGWLRTFDVAHINKEKQVLEITGRVKSMIVLHNGKKVFPEELEEQLEVNDLVKRALVWGETMADSEVILLARLQTDAEYIKEQGLSKEQVREAIKTLVDNMSATMPSFKKLRSVFYSETDMICTTTLKVKREATREQVIAKLTANEIDYTKGSQVLNLDDLSK